MTEPLRGDEESPESADARVDHGLAVAAGWIVAIIALGLWLFAPPWGRP